MEVHKNRWIEEWNAGRENLEFNFRWTRRSLAVVGLFGLAVPILVYKGIVREFVRTPPVPYRESSSCLLLGWLLVQIGLVPEATPIHCGGINFPCLFSHPKLIAKVEPWRSKNGSHISLRVESIQILLFVRRRKY